MEKMLFLFSGDYLKRMGSIAIGIFDGDAQTKQNDSLFNGIINNEQWIVAPDTYVVKFGYAYFGKDFETYFRASMPEYAERKKKLLRYMV